MKEANRERVAVVLLVLGLALMLWLLAGA